jgi:hypothetical protein
MSIFTFSLVVYLFLVSYACQDHHLFIYLFRLSRMASI